MDEAANFGWAGTDACVGTYVEGENDRFFAVIDDDVVTSVAGWWKEKHGKNKNNNRVIK